MSLKMIATLLCSLFCCASVAHAQVDPDTEIARKHYDAGIEFYDAGHYEEALKEFSIMRVTHPTPAIEFNIAKCLDRLEHALEAITAYERYLAGDPSARDAAEVRERIATLRARITGGAPSEPMAPTQPRRRRVATWIVGSAGVGLLVGSLAAGLVANARYGDLKKGCAADGACDVNTLPNAQSLIDGGHAAGIASDVLLSVGLAAVAAGVVLFFVEGRHPVERRAWRIAQ